MRILGAFLRRLADRLDPLAESNAAFVAALQREKARSYADEVAALLAERDAELKAELAETRGKRPTAFVRGLRAVNECGGYQPRGPKAVNVKPPPRKM